MRCNGFTLAEVLITLGIIGVVAAITLPALINNTQGQQHKAAFKKALSAISQAVTLSYTLDGLDFSDTVAGNIAGSTAKPVNGESIASLLSKKMLVAKVANSAYPAFDYRTCCVGQGPDGAPPDEEHIGCTPQIVPNCGGIDGSFGSANLDTVLYFNDGSPFTFFNEYGGSCSYANDKVCYGVVDVNGDKGPNKFVTCDGQTDYSIGIGIDCKVTNPTDRYPVMFFDRKIVPLTDAGRAVLYDK